MYEHTRQPRHKTLHSVSRLAMIWLPSVTHRYGMQVFPRQLDWERLGYDKDSGESEAECIELIIYLFVVIWISYLYSIESLVVA